MKGRTDDGERAGLQAAEWVVKADRGLTAEEQDEFFAWLASDPRHGDCFARKKRTWKEFNLLAEWCPEHSGEPNPRLLEAGPRSQRRWRILGGALAVAAGVALALVVWQPWRTLAPAWPETAPTTAGHRVLTDGSVVELNRGSEIDVQFTAEERHVRLLRGEAHFTVARNPQRPFVVSIDAVRVRAVGTAFNVKRAASLVDVLVTEGSVQVNAPARTGGEPAPEAPVLAAGQRTLVSLSPDGPPPQVRDVSAEEIVDRLAWKPRLLDFSSVALSKVVAEFNACSARTHGPRLVIADPELEAVSIIASFRSDNVEGFVRLLELTAGVRAERRGENEIMLHRVR